MNYMKDVALMLGLEWDDEKQESEQFNISDTIINPCKMTTEGTFNKFNSPIYCLYAILTGEATIQKLPWKPKHLQYVWRVSILSPYHKAIRESYNECDSCCKRQLELDLYRKTESEAIARTDEILRLLGVDA